MERQAFFTAQGKPFYSIGIQSHNSSSYMPEQLRETFHAAQLLEVNTVAVPVPWERYEPEEGCFDDAFISRILSLAREYQLHLVLLWFGTWKNGTMEYTPEWVKQDTTRFPRVELKGGRKVLNLSPHCPANLEADRKAFVRMMQTLKKLDSVYKNADSDKDDDSLRMGDSGSAVKDLQTKLKKLGYYDGTVDSTFGSGTYAAVRAFQKKYNLTADGVAGSETLKKLDTAYKNADSNTSTDDDSLRKGATGTAVKTLQTNLKKLGFYTAYVDGSFGSTTESAVKAFQKKYGLTADGVAGSATLKKIESAVASASSGKITTERLDWFNGGKYVIPNGAVFQIKDVSTGLIFSARRQSGGNHMDAEPLTAEDTAILKKINGGTFSWRRRAVLVKYNGHVYAASIYSEPHGTNTILDNNFDGQFCLHFYGSKTHGTDRVDADHQKCVEQAMKATW